MMKKTFITIFILITLYSFSSEKIVILDFAKMVLEMNGYNVVTSNSGENGLEVISKEFSNIDIVILDLMMPGLSGWETLKKIRENHTKQDLPVIIFTGNVREKENLASNEMAEEISDFILKPVSYEDLLARIAQAINK